MEQNGIDWGVHHLSFIEQALHFYEVTNLFTISALLYKKP